MKDQLPDKVPLKGPSGVLWDIELLKSDNVLFVGNEWKDFVKVNGLKENNLLMFKYKSNSTFEVLIFDQGSSCERESTYFVNKCMHPKSDLGDIEKKTTRKASSTEVIEDDDEEYSAFLVSKKSKKDNEGVVCSGEKVKTPTPSPSGNDAAYESRPISKRDYIAFQNEENFRVIDHSHKLKALYGSFVMQIVFDELVYPFMVNMHFCVHDSSRKGA
ncbi:B3 domain-containing protein Os12g0592300-like [Chenopodium quinoa]|uniref:B3 domain-containing protein Os12g0592300-like n=1 Tax=Chenopodium quinoa TaxID=63459 RepID=UPI000B790E9E|nr:B3 domain-containing protein Os12g0592300-like [Chenopodium quinoa]